MRTMQTLPIRCGELLDMISHSSTSHSVTFSLLVYPFELNRRQRRTARGMTGRTTTLEDGATKWGNDFNVFAVLFSAEKRLKKQKNISC